MIQSKGFYIRWQAEMLREYRGCDRNIAINRSNVKYMSESCLSSIPKPQVYGASRLTYLPTYPFKLMDRRCSESGNRSTLDDLSNSLPILISKDCKELSMYVYMYFHSLSIPYLAIMKKIFSVVREEYNFLQKLHFTFFLKKLHVHNYTTYF